MVNTFVQSPSTNLAAIHRLLVTYLIVVLAALAALATLSAVAPRQAPGEAWVHAVIVAGFAALLLARGRSARRGSVAALRAVGLISATLLLANVVLVLMPHVLPVWMKVEAVGIAALMAAVILLVVRERV
jgi:hypothetical protein